MFYYKELIGSLCSARIGNIVDKGKKSFLHLAVQFVTILRVGTNTLDSAFRSRERMTPFGNFDIYNCGTSSDYGGFRSEYLDANSRYDGEAYAALLRSNLSVDQHRAIDVRAHCEFADSSEAGMMFNLLRQYYLLSMGKLGKLAKGDYYNDGHLKISIARAFGSEGESVLVPIPYDFEFDNGYHNDFMQGKWTQSELEILVASVSELKGTGPVALASSSPRLTSNLNTPNMFETFEGWYQADKVYNVIRRLVDEYRMHNAFETATYMVAQMASNFDPPSAEGVMLRAAHRKMYIPGFRTARFSLPGLMRGNSGATRPSALANYRCWKRQPETMWSFSAVMNAAAEYRGVVSHGTDFDDSGALCQYFQDTQISSGIGKWAVFASSALGKEVHLSETFQLGHDPEEVQLREDLLFDKVGDLSGYDAEEREDGVRLYELSGANRQPYHSKLLFAIGLLPASKVGHLTTKGSFTVERSSKRKALAAVRYKDLSAYLTAARSFGWDVGVRLEDGKLMSNWSDNGTRLPWAPGELAEAEECRGHIITCEAREYNHRLDIDPLSKLTYSFELCNKGSAYEYSYKQAIITGGFPSSYKVTEGMVKDTVDIQITRKLTAPRIESKVQDFGRVPEPRQIPHPGEATGLIHPQDIPSIQAGMEEEDDPGANSGALQ
jgi:hypothetical protein